MDVGAFEAAFFAGMAFAILILYKLSGIGIGLLHTRIKANGNKNKLPQPTTHEELVSRDMQETKSAVYTIKNKQELNHQATLNCFQNMATEQSKSNEYLREMRDIMIKNGGK